MERLWRLYGEMDNNTRIQSTGKKDHESTAVTATSTGEARLTWTVERSARDKDEGRRMDADMGRVDEMQRDAKRCKQMERWRTGCDCDVDGYA